jgi:hypothetical protein
MLVLRRLENETWLQCTIRYGKKYGLEEEVTDEYNKWLSQGYSEDECALFACEEWDVIDYEEGTC